jgi:hypothetical protein
MRAFFGLGKTVEGAGTEGQLPAKHSAALEEMARRFPDAGRGVLMGYLKNRDWRVEEAVAQYDGTLRWQQTSPPGTIADFAPMMMTPPGCGGPDGCIVCLEDMKGDCARDSRGRPIIANIGKQEQTRLRERKSIVTKFLSGPCRDAVVSPEHERGRGTGPV